MLHLKKGNSPPIEFKSPAGRTLTARLLNGEPFWIAKEVCHHLGITKYRDAITKLMDDERVSINVDTLGGPQEMVAVNEAGFYRLIFSSNKKEVEPFKRWIFHEVLPAIRKSGRYESRRRKYVETDEERALFILIAMHLRVGDIKDIAEKNNWSRDRVSRVKRGLTVDLDIMKALSARAAHNMHHPPRKYGQEAEAQLRLFDHNIPSP